MERVLEGVLGTIFVVVIFAPLLGIWIFLNQFCGVEGPALCVMGIALYGSVCSLGFALIGK